MLTTNSDAQKLFTTAIGLLPEVKIDPLNPDPNAVKTQLVKTILIFAKMYSASSNPIPTLGGLGLEEALTLAEQVVELEGNVNNIRVNLKTTVKGVLQS